MKFHSAPPVSTHTAEEGWPHNPGQALQWAHPRGGVETGRYLRLDSDLIEQNWGDSGDSGDFGSVVEMLVDDHEDEENDPENPLTELICAQHAAEAEGKVEEATRLSHESDRITFGRAYGVHIRVTFDDEWPQDGDTYRTIPLSQAVRV